MPLDYLDMARQALGHADQGFETSRSEEQYAQLVGAGR